MDSGSGPGRRGDRVCCDKNGSSSDKKGGSPAKGNLVVATDSLQSKSLKYKHITEIITAIVDFWQGSADGCLFGAKIAAY